MERLKPNGISHTTYPDNPATDFNQWIAHITSQEVARDADEFQRKADEFQRKAEILWADTFFKTGDEADEYKRKFDSLWNDFKKSVQRVS